VRDRLPLAGRVIIAEPIEDSTACLAARTSAVSTGSPALDRLLAGAALPDAAAFPEISFRSGVAGLGPRWLAGAVGRLRVKNAEHELACQFDLHLRHAAGRRAARRCAAHRHRQHLGDRLTVGDQSLGPGT
jgi:polyisoprenoid-binding protein YceI